MKNEQIVAIAKKYKDFTESFIIRKCEELGMSDSDIDRVLEEVDVMNAWSRNL